MKRSTIRLDDDLMLALKDRAHRESTSVTKLINQAIRGWLADSASMSAGSKMPTGKARPFRQRTFDTGPPRFDVTMARHLAAELEDEGAVEKLRHGN